VIPANSLSGGGRKTAAREAGGITSVKHKPSASTQAMKGRTVTQERINVVIGGRAPEL
jgi:hypothetical protein